MVNFLGVGLDAITYKELFSHVDRWIADKTSRSHHIACVNAYCVTLALKNERLRKIYNGADICGPDGVPFVKWIRRVNNLPCDRIAAPETIIELARHSRKKGYTFYLYGGHPEIVKEMKRNLEIKFPHIRIVGYFSPPFRALTKEEDDKICEEINKLKPDIVCVGLGTPKQDYWIDDHIYKIRGSVFIASGASFDFFGGRIKMAPNFIRESGFEWLYRLFSRDFFRLWKRYTLYNILFVWNFCLQLAKIRIIEPERWKRSDKIS
jgi:N-acetylglucosaminyldiphosphoundecaprenol N-acetyl-beta-D-mannosaminyltransferase